MIREIKKRMVVLNNRKPFKSETKNYLRDLELSEWIFMNLRLSGSRLSKENIDTVLEGGYLLHASIEEHLVIERLQNLYRYVYRQLDMKADLSVEMLNRMHWILNGNEKESDYRKNNPVLLEYGYNPVTPDEIPKAMADMIFFSGREHTPSELFLKAAQIHNRIIEIYPYKTGNECLARAAMYYLLAAEGYPMAAISMSEQEYNNGIITYLKKGESGILCQALTEAVYRRLELMIQITAYDGMGV